MTMAHTVDADQHKRKRDVADDNGSQVHDRIPQPPPPQSVNTVPINYLSRSPGVKLKLIQGDGDTFSNALDLISEYEGVLNRHESLAFNLGAKLTGSRLLKAMEGAFEGPITTTPPQNQFTLDPVTWLDIVDFAKSHPQEFQLSATPSGMRYCQFPLKDVRVEIGEDDWRLIVSGALDRFRLVPPQPLEEDEAAELATVEILEQRLQVLIKKADEVARRARQLNYHLSGRKASIHSRQPSQSTTGSVFQPVNAIRQASTNPIYDLHADLLQQFAAPVAQPPNHRISSASSLPPTPNPMSTASSTPRTSVQQHSFINSHSNRPSPSYISEPITRDAEEENRVLVTSRIEKMTRGEVIRPPCDRCRRLKTQCIKHLTACQGCTKKHTKCTWKRLTEEEATLLKGETSGEGDEEEDEPRSALWKGSLVSPLRPPEISDLGAGPERDGGEPTVGQLGPRLVVGRPADEIWRKGPGHIRPGRDDSMDIDPSPRQPYVPEEATNYTAIHSPIVDARIRQVASAASARADAAAREGQHHS
ncbi:putative C6 finger domain-containing protein [Rosellinia necatrix]|uniref:Putative C6 finger domain-containing protein n=1 Tax=Rosellinia necatrix TaxID=77044 RepID=A0A1W2TNJ2_ROSNE|nr:putative C6 finger domain-containing protein [Rosellinia necatrix]